MGRWKEKVTRWYNIKFIDLTIRSNDLKKWSLFDLFTKPKPKTTYPSVTLFSEHWKGAIPSSLGNDI